MDAQLDRRRLLKVGGGAFALVAVGGSLGDQVLTSPASAQVPKTAAAYAFAKKFKSPHSTARPWFRYWIPGSYPEPSEIRAEINQMADAGFGGAEIVDLPEQAYFDPVEYGWANARWNSIIEAALDQMRIRHMHASLTVGPAWPAAVPTITPDSDAASKQLVYGQVLVQAGTTFSGPLPDATVQAAAGVTTRQLIAVQAFQAVSVSSSSSTPTQLAGSSMTDLTDQVTGDPGAEELTWTNQTSDTWVLIAFYMRGTGQTIDVINPTPPTSPQSYVVDHFALDGTQAVEEFWEAKLLTPKIKKLLRQVPTSLFEDSIEVNGGGGTRWTPNMLAEFGQRRGYSLTPFLALVVSPASSGGFGSTAASPYSFGDETDARVAWDYEQTLSDLYLRHHTYRLQEWAHGYGMTYKSQQYGGYIDTALASATIDQPEGETLDDGAYSERWRVIAGGAHLGSRPIISDEMDATGQNAYRLTWSDFMLPTANANYAAGVNRGIIHGFPTEKGPHSVWPGNDGFSGVVGPFGTGDNWGPRQPTWTHITDMSGYLTRSQLALQTGIPKIDVAVYRQSLDVDIDEGYWSDTTLVRTGYTYEYQSAGSLASGNARVKRRRLAPDGPAYKALVIDAQPSMPIKTAQTMLRFARAGLPIVVVGDAPDATPGLYKDASEDATLQSVIGVLLEQDSVYRVDTEAEVPAMLASVGILPATRFSSPSNIRTVHRHAEGLDLYFLTNIGTVAESNTLSVANTGSPYVLNMFDGSTEAIGQYTASDGRLHLPVTLAAGDATVIALGRTSAVGVAAPRLHATSSGGTILVRGGRLLVRATSAGTIATHLSTGRAISTEISHVHAPLSLTEWHLRVSDWQPGATAYQTVKTTHDVTLDGLKPWDQIDGLEDVSGVGMYTTTFNLGATGWSGAYVDLGDVFDTFRVWINGRELPPQNIITARVDLGTHLRKGSNKLVVEVATTLNNRLRVVRPDDFGNKTRQDYGLIGPVTLTPYVDRVIG